MHGAREAANGKRAVWHDIPRAMAISSSKLASRQFSGSWLSQAVFHRRMETPSRSSKAVRAGEADQCQLLLQIFEENERRVFSITPCVVRGALEPERPWDSRFAPGHGPEWHAARLPAGGPRQDAPADSRTSKSPGTRRSNRRAATTPDMGCAAGSH